MLSGEWRLTLALLFAALLLQLTCCKQMLLAQATARGKLAAVDAGNAWVLALILLSE